MEIPLSRLAREAKVVRVSGIVSGLAAADSIGLLARRHCAARPSRPGIRDSGSRGITPPYSRASATGLHRLPGTESAVDVAEDFSISDWPGCRDSPGERSCGAPKQKRAAETYFRLQLHVAIRISTLRRVLVAPRTQINAWPPRRAQLDFERRFEDLFEQLPLVHRGGRSDAQARTMVKQHNLVGEFRRER